MTLVQELTEVTNIVKREVIDKVNDPSYQQIENVKRKVEKYIIKEKRSFFFGRL